VTTRVIYILGLASTHSLLTPGASASFRGLHHPLNYGADREKTLMNLFSPFSSVDGVFGRCQELAGADLHTYDISSSALQRLRILLQKLAHRGLTWQDDITQQVISRELSKLKNIPLHHQATPPSLLTTYSSSRDRKLRPGQDELTRNLHKYLTGLGFLPRAEIDGQPGVQHEVANIQQPFFSCPERFIQNLVNQLGRHSINMDALMGKDLDQLAEVITGALREVDVERPALEAQPGPGATDSRGNMEGNREPQAAIHLNQDQDLKSDKEQDLNQKNTLRMKQQGPDFVNIELEWLILLASSLYAKLTRSSIFTDHGPELLSVFTFFQKPAHSVSPLLFICSVLGPALTFRVGPNPKNVTTADLVQVAGKSSGPLTQIPVVKETRVESGQFLLLSVLCMLFILVAVAVSATFFCVRQRSHLHMKEKLASLGTDTSTDATATYQELCRQRMAIRTSERVERPETLRHSRLNSVSSQFSDGPAASPSTRSSTSSWCEEPVPSNMDISTGHMILSYMEDHLKNKNRLEREWEALCSYQAEPSACSVGQGEQNSKRNRSDAVVAYDHSRITLKAENNHSNSDYINASPIMDHDPRNPTYIASQGPLASTVADFWQMVWESGCVVIVMLTPLSENGVKQCHHYWPDEGSDVYHIYEVNLVSEHIWCEDFLVRSFYLKNLQTNETRTVTQFHFLSWMDRGIPSSARTLLDFRRKVNKCYRGRSCPIIVHCSDGAGRSGTYILIDMVLNRMAKGAKEIDIAATLEHLRDQRAGMVQTKVRSPALS
uniref:Protein tyrosine phosphatase receptor type N2 n=1 Tax=Astatotilapia calliptera TaxID=8154 RepID=A0AAX7TM34_ASTCA